MMNLAKMSTNGQITIPVEIRRTMNVTAEDKIVFMQNDNGEIVIHKLNVAIIKKSKVLESNTAVG